MMYCQLQYQKEREGGRKFLPETADSTIHGILKHAPETYAWILQTLNISEVEFVE